MVALQDEINSQHPIARAQSGVDRGPCCRHGCILARKQKILVLDRLQRRISRVAISSAASRRDEIGFDISWMDSEHRVRILHGPFQHRTGF